MYRAAFKILEPYLFRGSGEFDPSTRGVYSSAYSLLVPSPSTAAGAIATVFEYIDTRSLGWDSAYSIVLRGARLRGPYLRRGSLYYVENRIDGVFLRLEDVPSYSNMKKKQLYGEIDERLEEEEKKLARRGFVPKKLTFVGIGLRTRIDMRKIADEEGGLIYTVNFIDYNRDSEIDTAIEFDIISEKMEIGKHIVRLGGERRASLLEISKVDSCICRIPEDVNLLYVLSPVLYETGIEFTKRLREELREVGEVRVYGRIETLGAGYSEIRRKRKPIYQALLPGSVISLEKSIKGRKIYEEGIGVGKEIGFGSVIPVEVIE
jgi:CRISPR-associated protein Cmr3